ncbi:MAG TPA: glycosyltransferase [Bacteroidales bacterium]|nr:glycosyltransferase [Bacteroidales bacterium]
MEYQSSENQKIFKFESTGIDVFSIYQIQFSYTSMGMFAAIATLTNKDNMVIHHFLPEITFLKGTNEMTFNIVTSFYGKLTKENTKDLILGIFPRSNKFSISSFLTSAIMTPEEKADQLNIDISTFSFKKLFDLRLQVSQPKYLLHNLRPEPQTRNTPVIMHGFYNKEDGLGAHLPNIYENVIYDYKEVSFNRQTNRYNGHFSFLNRELDVAALALPKYDKDFKWMNFYFSNENIHVIQGEKFKNCAFIHVGGLGLTEQELWEDKKLLTMMKNTYNATIYFYLMWESDDISQIKEILECVDHIIVTNSWLKNLIAAKLPNKHVHCVEHIANYYSTPALGDTENFVYGYSGGLWSRKNVDMIIRAFNDIKTEKIKLQIHSREFVNTPEMLNVVKKEILVNPENIELKNETLKNEDYAKWWSALNCYVFVSSGESYSITPRQALMQGTPVILSKNTAHLDLLDIPGILWVETAEVRKAQFSGDPTSSVNIGNDFVPDEEQLKERMKEVKENYKYWKEQAILGGKLITKLVDPKRIKQQWDMLLI